MNTPLRTPSRSEEHTSELQSRQYLVCRLLLEKKKNKQADFWVSCACVQRVVDSQSAQRYYPFFFFNDTATTEIYTLSLHDALPILPFWRHSRHCPISPKPAFFPRKNVRSEEHTSELQSRQYLVCRLLLEKKKK